jgi:hypothetical protein
MILWNMLKVLASTYRVKATFKEAELLVEFQNGSVLYLMGANDESVAETLRGTPWDLVVIDECASFRGHIKYLIEECIDPSFITRNGKLRLIGTPSIDFTSYFYEADTKLPTWSRHSWNTIDNVYIPHAKDYVEKKKIANGWTDDNPVYLREWMGQWAKSTDDQVYAYNPLKNLTSSLPAGDWFYVIGVDLGWNDDTAIVVIAYNPHQTRNSYIIHQWKKSKLLISTLGEILVDLKKQYNPMAMIVDEGGLGKSIAEELNNRFHLSLQKAEKTQKLAYIEFINSDITNGYLKIVDDGTSGGALATEWTNLTWAAKGRMEDPKQPNHLSDSVLYSWRHCFSYLYTNKQQQPKQKSRELAAFEDDIYEENDDDNF